MPKQNLNNPKFRCNYCKEYHTAPEHMRMYQCATHGYLCEKCVISDESKFEFRIGVDSHEFGNQNSELVDVYDYKIQSFPSRFHGICRINPDHNKLTEDIGDTLNGDTSKEMLLIRNFENSFWLLDNNFFNPNQILKADSIEGLIDEFENNNDNTLVNKFFQSASKLCKKTIRYDWSIEHCVWVEEGITHSGNKKVSLQNHNSNIKLLVELFEKDRMTKEEFLSSIKEYL